MKSLDELLATFEERRNAAVLSYQEERRKLDEKHSREIAEWSNFIVLAPKILEALEKMGLGVAQWNYCGNLDAVPVSEKFRFSRAREANYDALTARAEKIAGKIEQAVDNKLSVAINPFSLHLRDDEGNKKCIIIDLRVKAAATVPTSPARE